jgi:hypothetical protein
MVFIQYYTTAFYWIQSRNITHVTKEHNNLDITYTLRK